MRLTAWHHLYRANLTNAYTKKNIQTTSSIKMTPINNGGHTRWKILATALRTTVKSDGRPCNLIRADRSVTFYRANRPICPKNIARVGDASLHMGKLPLWGNHHECDVQKASVGRSTQRDWLFGYV